jgi:hypothetical protein
VGFQARARQGLCGWIDQHLVASLDESPIVWSVSNQGRTAMAAVKTNLYIALVNAGVPEGQAAKLAAADAKLNIESALIAALEPFAKMRKLQQTLEDGCREMMAKDNKGMMDDDRDRPIMKSKSLATGVLR